MRLELPLYGVLSHFHDEGMDVGSANIADSSRWVCWCRIDERVETAHSPSVQQQSETHIDEGLALRHIEDHVACWRFTMSV